MLAQCLLLLRLAVAAFMLQWVIGKFVNPAESAQAFAVFYKVDLDSRFSPLLGGAQLVAVIAFATGFRRWVSYGLIMAMNLIATLSTWQYLVDPFGSFEHRLFWNAVPVAVVSIVLFRMRNSDTLASLDSLIARRTA
ncbi:MAG: hypothetical protein SFV21_03850 [Rhodospirillaceae bacterium]|nr:hypothetical protein [Rhodospirillaceae bacterium]